MNFANKQISYFFSLRYFLMLFEGYEISSQKSYFFPFRCFLMLLEAYEILS